MFWQVTTRKSYEKSSIILLQYLFGNISKKFSSFPWYFKTTGTNFRNTNGEFLETVHYSLKKHEFEHGYVVKKKQGTPSHLLKSLQSISSYNSLGSTPPQEFTLWRKSTPSPNSTPKVKKWISPILCWQDIPYLVLMSNL